MKAGGNLSAEVGSDISRKSVRGGAATFAAQLVTICLQLLSTVILARLLGPEEYGILGMAASVTTFAAVFRDLGLSSATIQSKELNQQQLSALFWINVSAGAALTLLVAGAAPLVARFFQREELLGVTMALSLTFVINSCGTQHGALLSRRMMFGKRAIATIVGAVVGLVVAVGFALRGAAYWALVTSSIASSLTTTILLWWAAAWRPGPPSGISGVSSQLKFGANITAFEFVNYFARNFDSILIGRVWGADALGLYSRAYQLLMFPITNLRGPIQAVAFPAMSQLQCHGEEYRRYYRNVVALLALFSMPVSCFLGVAADLVVRVVLGEAWGGVAPVFSVLAVTAFIQPCSSLSGLVCMSLGSGTRYLRMGIAGAAIATLGFVCGIPWGPVGVASAYAVTTYLGLVPFCMWTVAGTHLRVMDFFGSVWRPALASIAAGGTALLTKQIWKLEFAIADLLKLGITFMLAYVAALLILPGGRRQMQDFWNLGGGMLQHRRS